LKRRAEQDEIGAAASADLAEGGHSFDPYQGSVHAAMISRAVSQVLR
jgi:hypothetical protein